MPSFSPRLFALVAVLVASGCSTEPKWPVPQNTTDIVLQDGRRELITTVTLGDALHLVLPAPLHSNTQWQILAMNTIALRQMSDLKPVTERTGAEEITFQAIKTTARTVIQFAAIDPQATATTPDDFFSISVGIKQPVRSVPALGH